jgi:hypothetical protein
MELVIPDDARVHITIGQPPLLIPPSDTRAVTSVSEPPRGRIAKAILAGVLLIGAFQAGRFLPRHPDTASAAPTTAAAVAPGATDGGAQGEIPPVFRAQITQPPRVFPPPGAAPAAASVGSADDAAVPAATPASVNPFGLRN